MRKKPFGLINLSNQTKRGWRCLLAITLIVRDCIYFLRGLVGIPAQRRPAIGRPGSLDITWYLAPPLWYRSWSSSHGPELRARTTMLRPVSRALGLQLTGWSGRRLISSEGFPKCVNFRLLCTVVISARQSNLNTMVMESNGGGDAIAMVRKWWHVMWKKLCVCIPNSEQSVRNQPWSERAYGQCTCFSIMNSALIC